MGSVKKVIEDVLQEKLANAEYEPARAGQTVKELCEYIKESEVKTLCQRAKEILIEESNVQNDESHVTVNITSIALKLLA